MPFFVGYWRTHLPLLNCTMTKQLVVLPSLNECVPAMPPALKSVSDLMPVVRLVRVMPLTPSAFTAAFTASANASAAWKA